MTTVGYGDVYPITPEGRLAASVLMLLGIGLFSAITATVTSYLLESGERGVAPTLVDELARLAALRDAGALSDDEYTVAKARVLDLAVSRG